MTPQRVHWRQMKHHWQAVLLVLPSLLIVGLFQYYPVVSGVFHSFFRWNGSDICEYVGLENYRDLVSNTAFWMSFKVALLLGAWNVVKMIPALAVAVCIHRCRSERMQWLYRVLFVVPMVIPGLVVVMIWRSFFFEASAGYLNRVLEASGGMKILAWIAPELFGGGHAPAWLGDPRLILVACVVWGFPWVGSFAVLTHLAKLQGISKDVYEAAEIDGVNWISRFTRIELPLMMGSIYLLLVFVIIDTIKDAGMVLALAGIDGGPGGVATVPALFMIRKAFIDQQMGYACAVGVVLTVAVLLLQKISQVVMGWSSGSLHWWTAKREQIQGTSTGVFNSSAAQERARLAFERATDPAHLLRRRASAFALRAAKHGFILTVLAMAFLPLYLMLVVSLKSNPQFYAAPATLTYPLHWENWSQAWDVVTPTVANSLFVSMSATGLALIFAMGAAYFFARLRTPVSVLLWNAMLILMMMPAIANLVPLFRLLRDMSLLNTLTALVLVGASGGQVFALFVLRNFVADVPQELFESAEIDGASHWQQLRVIVIPLCGPVLGTVGVMQFVANWNDFVLPLIVIRDHARLPVMVQLLRMAGEYIKLWGPLMAGYAMASVPIIVLFVFSMRLFVRGLTEGAVKG